MSQYYLKFPDEQTAIEFLEKYRGVDEDGNEIWITGSHDHALVVLGTLYIFPDTLFYGEEEYPPLPPEVVALAMGDPLMVASDGFHVNLIAEELPAGMHLGYVAIPEFPKNVWL